MKTHLDSRKFLSIAQCKSLYIRRLRISRHKLYKTTRESQLQNHLYRGALFGISYIKLQGNHNGRSALDEKRSNVSYISHRGGELL